MLIVNSDKNEHSNMKNAQLAVPNDNNEKCIYLCMYVCMYLEQYWIFLYFFILIFFPIRAILCILK